MVVKSKSGSSSTKYFDLETGLMLKEESQTGAQEITEYQEIEGLKFPKKMKLTIPGLGAVEAEVEVKLNSGVADADFEIKK